MRFRPVAIALLLTVFSSAAYATCEWKGELGEGGTPKFRNCPADAVAYADREHRCRMAKEDGQKQPAFCANIFDQRAAVFQANKNAPDVAIAVTIYLNSSVTTQRTPVVLKK